MRSSLHRKRAAALQVGVDDDAGDVVLGEPAGVALDAHVAEAVRGEARLEHVSVHAGRDHPVDLARAQRLRQERHVGRQVVRGDVTVRTERLGMGQHQLGPLRAELGEPDPSVDVLAEVDHVDTGAQLGHRHGAQLLDRTDRRRGRDDERVVAAVADLHRRPGRPPEQPAVLVLALDQVRERDVARRPEPGLVGAHDGRRAVRVLDLELGEEGGLGPPLVVGAGHAHLTAVPPVGQEGVELVVALAQQPGHVVRLHLGVVLVLGEPRRQLHVADPDAVQLGLVDPVRRGVERGALHRPLEREARRAAGTPAAGQAGQARRSSRPTGRATSSGAGPRPSPNQPRRGSGTTPVAMGGITAPDAGDRRRFR